MILNQDVLEGLEESTLVDIIKAMRRHHDCACVAEDVLGKIYGKAHWHCKKCSWVHHPDLPCLA